MSSDTILTYDYNATYRLCLYIIEIYITDEVFIEPFI